jgi:hypothetical protein
VVRSRHRAVTSGHPRRAARNRTAGRSTRRAGPVHREGGAILRFAVYDQNTNGFNVGTIGVILLIVGIIGLIISIVVLTMRRRTDVYHHDADYIEPGPPPPRRFYYR